MTFLLDLTVKGTLLMTAAFLIALVWRRSAARYALWACALAAMLLVPFVPNVGRGVDLTRTATALVPNAPITTLVVSGHKVSESKPAPTRDWPLTIWIAGMAAMFARIAVGQWQLRSRFKSAELLETHGRIAIRRSSATDVPLSYGLFRATILLPGDADQWSDERRRVVLEHELTHARRLDSLWSLIAQASVAVHWFNPLAWLALRRFRREQERSCDDAVVMAGIAPAAYATHLVDLARSIAVPDAALSMADKSDLEGRVHALLDSARDRRGMGGAACAGFILATLAVTVPLASIHAQTAANGSLTGGVYDPSGAVIPHATLRLKSTSGPNEGFAYAGPVGTFKLEVPAGEYTLKVAQPGFAAYQRIVTLAAGAVSTMNVNLSIGDVTEALEIVGKRPQPAPASNDTPKRIRVGGNVQAMKLISRVAPDYPADAQAAGVEGTVLLRAIVSKDGSLLSIASLANGVDPRLVNAAKAAVPLWRYQPTMLNGEPVEVVTTIAVIFRLN